MEQAHLQFIKNMIEEPMLDVSLAYSNKYHELLKHSQEKLGEEILDKFRDLVEIGKYFEGAAKMRALAQYLDSRVEGENMVYVEKFEGTQEQN